MTRCLVFSGVLLATILVSSLAAQRRQGGGSSTAVAVTMEGHVMPGPDPNSPMQMFSLLLSSPVQDALGLSAPARNLFNNLDENHRRQVNDAALAYRNGDITKEERLALYHRLTDQKQAMMDEGLTPEQQERLGQLAFRVEITRMGLADSITNGRLSLAIGVHDQQKTKLREKARELQAAAREKIRQVMAEMEDELFEQLAPEQRDKAKAIVGDYVAIVEPSRFQLAYRRTLEQVAKEKLGD